MTAFKLLTSVLLASLVMTSLVQGACQTRPLTFDSAPRLQASKAALSVYCSYRGQKKRLASLWIDQDACVRCFCRFRGLECCTLDEAQAQRLC